MDIDVIEEEENPMLHRTDVRFEVTHEEATPSRLSVRDSLAAMLNKDAEEVVVHELDTKFGMRTTVGYAKVYETPDHALEVEQEYVLRRNKIGGDGSEAEEAEDEAEEEEPAEASESEEAEEAEVEAEEEEPAEASESEEAEAEDEESAAADEPDEEGEGEAEGDEEEDGEEA